MVSLHWDQSLELGFVPMDDLHKQLVAHMSVVDGCPDNTLAAEWQSLVACAHALFAQEDAWMKHTHFSSAPNHSLHHRVVLNVLREGLVMARANQFDQVRKLSAELAHWLSKHIQSQDAALALHMRRHPGACKLTGTLH
jgi:hemerythrin-like metal-binding protein